MKNLILLTFLLLFSVAAFSQAPCSVQGFANPVQIACGDSAVLSAFGTGSGNVAFQETFNSGSPVGWQFTQTVTIANNTCGVPSPDGSNFMWMGDASVNPRDMATVPFNLTLGGTICFEMRYSIQGDASPCEGPDEPQEGVYVQYSIDNGANWVTIQYWSPNGGNDPQLVNWNQYCVAIPAAAMTANTMIRWHQDNVSGAEFDHWGIDNVIITLNDPNYTISWQHDGYSYGMGSAGGVNPNVVNPTTTTSYTVQITDGTNTCTDVVNLVVTNPDIIVTAGPDTTLCPGECVTIDATAYWQVEPAGPRPFINDVSQDISGGGSGNTTSIDINVNGLNIGAIASGDIMEVCITGMSYFGFAFPPTTVGDFNIILQCPGGGQITLVPSGVTSSTLALPGYVQTCFSMTAVNPISSGTAPYTGTWQPQQPFDNLNGCSANGIWTMILQSTTSLSIGLAGAFDGWSITFDDPGLTAPVNYSWSPTTNMTNSNTLSPTVCPTQTGTYTLTASNSPGCQPATADVTITVPNSCCLLTYDNVALQNPACGTNNGSITVTVTGAIAGLEYSIDNGATFQPSNTFTGLAPGSYTVVVRDDNDCPITQTVVLSNPNQPNFGTITLVDNTSCQTPNGSITVAATGGTGAPYTYSINGGAFQSTGTFGNLTAGTYTITVNDASSCQTDTSLTITSPSLPNIVSIAAIDANCGANDGSANVIVVGGVAPYSYAWSPSGGSAATATGLASGNYSVSVTDSSGCTVSGTVEVGVIVTDSLLTFEIETFPETCAGNDGAATVTVTDGVPPYSFQWDIVGGSDSSSVFGLIAATYNVTITDLCYSETVPVVIDKSFIQPDKELPNVFTPNSKDGVNDIYAVPSNFSGVNNFYCIIYNRWGYPVHKTEDKEINWAPKTISDGVYFIVVTYTDCLGEAEKIASTITLASGK